MKKTIILVLIIVFAVFVGIFVFRNLNIELTQIGTSSFYFKLPNGYKETEDDFDEDQIAYYYKDDESIDFDVYQWQKENKYFLEDEANYFAAEYNTTASKVNVNGIAGMKYISNEMYDNNEYTVVNYMFEDEENIIELSFWTINNEKEFEDVNKIINTITQK